MPGQKEPACVGGLHAATTDLSQIDSWWTENPHYNVAGDPESAGLCVVDIDAKRQPDGTKGVDTWRRLVEQHGAPNTYWVATPSGGLHVYFRGDLPTTAGKIAPGIDTRGAGRGYVLLAPSMFNGVSYKPSIEHAPGGPPAGAFEPIPAWISQAVTAPRYRDQATREYVERSQKMPVQERELIAILRYLDPDCAYDPWFVYIGAIRATRLASVVEGEMDARLLDIAQAWSRGDYWSLGPVRWAGDDDVETKFWAMPPKPGGTTFGTLWNAARAAGYDKPPPRLPDEAVFVGVECPITSPDTNGERALDPAVAERMKRFRTVLPSEAVRRRPPRFYDKDKLFLRAPGGSSTIIFAAYSNFKTTFSCGRSLAIAKEHDARVLYVVCEGVDGFGPLTLQAAVKDWNASHPGDEIRDDWLDVRDDDYGVRLTTTTMAGWVSLRPR